jgi:hypothetical protein
MAKTFATHEFDATPSIVGRLLRDGMIVPNMHKRIVYFYHLRGCAFGVHAYPRKSRTRKMSAAEHGVVVLCVLPCSLKRAA